MSTDLTLRDLESNTRAENRLVLGRLVASTNRRDLVWPMNGDDAMRIMKVFASRTSKSGWGDQIDPTTSEARHGWIAWHNAKFVAMHWEPDWDATSENIARAILDAGPDAIGLAAKIEGKTSRASDHTVYEDLEDEPGTPSVDRDSDPDPGAPPEPQPETPADARDDPAAEGDADARTTDTDPTA